MSDLPPRKRFGFEWRLGLCLLIALAISAAVLSGLQTDFEQRMAEVAIREQIQEAKAEAERHREQAAHEPPRPDHQQKPSSPAVADEPIDFEDVFRLRTDPAYRKRALKWAEEEEARRAKNRRPREETPQQREAAATRRLTVARQLEAEGFPSKARVHYRVIAEKYPETQAAKEAAQALEPRKP